MSKAPPYDFELAPDLPGTDRLAKYIFIGLRGLTHRLWDFEIEGSDHVPVDGPAIITPNHLSFCDSIFVPSALPRRAWAIGKGEYMDSWKTKHIFPAMGMVPVNRGGGRAAMAALDTAAGVLEGGHLFMIYPEGTRSRSGNLHKGRTGAARLAIRCDAPIVPVGHQGTVDVQPPDSVLMKPFKPVTVRFGAPMWARDHGDPEDPRTLRRFTDAVMFEISELSGQTYVDQYAGKKADVATAATETAPAPSTPPRPRIRVPVRRPVRVAATDDSVDTDEHERVTPKRPSVVGDGPSKIPTPPARPTVDPSAVQPDPSGPITMPADRREPTPVGG